MHSKASYFLLTCFLVVQTAIAAEPAPAMAYKDPAYGYSIRIPQFPANDNLAIVQRIIWFAPVQNQFAPNINIQIQNTNMTPADFWSLTQKQFTQFGATVIAHKDLTITGKPAMTIEYTANNGGTTNHFLQLAVFESGRVILVTCTATETTFKQYESEFQAVLDSFRP